MNNQTIELKFGTPTPIYYNDPNYGKIQFLIRGIFKCNAVDQNINVDEINNVIVTNANVWISEVIQQNQNVEYEKNNAKDCFYFICIRYFNQYNRGAFGGI